MSNDASSDHVAKPWTRWWWMGNAVTREGITRHLEAYARVGLGGVEITPIYGAQGAEPGYLPLLGPAWAEMVRHAILEGRRLGIGVDMTLGSGWPYGGPHVAAAGGARRAEFVRIALAAGPCEQCFPGKRVEAAAAQLAGGELVRVPYPAGADRLAWDVPAGGATLFALLSAPTGQTVKRAAPGGAGLVMSPYSAQAFAAFIAPYDDLFEDGHPVPRCFFYDSFEVFGADCEADIAAASERRTGRRLADHLPALMGEAAADLVERVRHDYREVLAGLLLDEGVAAWVDWCRARGAAARYQAHGAPGNLIDLYAAADVPETEVFGTSRFPWLATGPHPEVVDCFYPLVNKLASSAAHLTGKRLVSSETFTWHREHYCGTFAQMRPEFDQLMLTGINHVVLHGSTYSPADVPFPGWQFYASTHFDVGHPLWREMPTFAEYVTFNQRLLQGSRVVGDVLVYFPFHDVISQAEGDLFLPLSVHKLPADMRGSAWGRLAGELWDAGLAFDFVSDRLLGTCTAAADGTVAAADQRYRVVVVPPCRYLPLDTVRRLTDLARAGAWVVLAGDLSASAPGLAGLADVNAYAAARAALEAAATCVEPHQVVYALGAQGIRPQVCGTPAGVRGMRVRRDEDGAELCFIANHSPYAFAGWIELAARPPERGWAIVDAMRRTSGRAAARDRQVYVSLEPGESRWLVSARDEAPWPYDAPDAPPQPLDGAWTLEALEGGPNLPPPVTGGGMRSWTELSPAWAAFAGTARYTLRFVAPPLTDCGWRLVFPAVAEALTVTLNGEPLGSVICPPYHFDVTTRLRAGENVLECDVTNAAVNRIIAMDRQGVPWRTFHEINFVNITYQPFDASGWTPRPSGLVGVPYLQRVRAVDP